MSRNKTESFATSATEQNRRSNARGSLPSPQHASSMPAAVNGSPTSSKCHDVSPLVEPGRFEKSRDSTDGISDTVNATREPLTDGQPRQRKITLSNLFHKGKKEKNGLQREPTSNSKRAKHRFTVVGQLRATIFNSYLNVLFVFIPIGIAMHFAKVGPVVIFVTNFIAIIPLAAMLSYATEEIALRTGETIGGLLNATFGWVQTNIWRYLGLIWH